MIVVIIFLILKLITIGYLSIRIIVTDQDNVRRNALIRAVDENMNVRVISDLRSGKKALENIKRLLPNVVIIGDELSDMSGFAFVMQLMKIQPVAVLIVSNDDNKTTVDFPKALDFGIVDTVTIAIKDGEINYPSIISHRVNILNKLSISRFQSQIDQINNYSPVRHKNRKIIEQGRETREKVESIRKILSNKNLQSSKSKLWAFPKIKTHKRVIVIGASTGGPKLLTYIVSQFPPNFPPVLVIQHMPSGFVDGFAERMNQNARMKVKMAAEGDILQNGTVYIAQGGYHMELDKSSGVTRIKITEGAKVNFVRPAVDVTLFSAVRAYGSGVTGVILTGMGADGREGCRVVKKQKGTVIALNEEDSVIYGMNKAVIDAGLADKILGMDDIAKHIGLSLKNKIEK
ncbi:MAG: Chemotaxis response regulator protein-glutamate methylesterase of group 1 operon [Candidatus Heimdallarchaeota archaeon LC_2]|nr:MAG: Chemotaxis response regulator protein-glutamate methylesterase of group 1 operon [Candidatus Heimdallarchaeota archaeon LC_2]